MNENEFERNGKKYIAKEIDCKCRECAFFCKFSDCCGAPLCNPDRRADRRSVIFVEKSKPEQKPEPKPELEQKPKPKTNGDRIRGMSNEELADFLSDITDCVICPIHDFCRTNKKYESCCEAMLDWMNVSAEEASPYGHSRESNITGQSGADSTLSRSTYAGSSDYSKFKFKEARGNENCSR